jgi:phosphotransferase system enzyme I (PtsP)
VTIVARAMGVPVVGRVADIRHIANEGDTILLDGDSGTVVVRPNRPLVNGFDQRMSLSQKRCAEFAAIRALLAETTNGEHITLMVNAGLAEDAAMLEAAGAEGIGLFRPIPVPDCRPTARPGSHCGCTNVLEAAGDKPVIFRTVDIGGDKALPFFRRPERRKRKSRNGLAGVAAQPRAQGADEGSGAR